MVQGPAEALAAGGVTDEEVGNDRRRRKEVVEMANGAGVAAEGQRRGVDV